MAIGRGVPHDELTMRSRRARMRGLAVLMAATAALGSCSSRSEGENGTTSPSTMEAQIGVGGSAVELAGVPQRFEPLDDIAQTPGLAATDVQNGTLYLYRMASRGTE